MCYLSFFLVDVLKRALPVHDVVNKMNIDLGKVFPAIHKLTGCDTTSKVETTASSFKAATTYGFELLHSLAESDTTESMLLF